MLSDEEAAAVSAGLRRLLAHAEAEGEVFFSDETAEDVHSISSELIEGSAMPAGSSTPAAAGTTGRDRMRLWLRGEIDCASKRCSALQAALLDLADAADVVFPGYTHLQRAQPVLFAHWCLAYFEMLERDRGASSTPAARERDAARLGALAGTTLPDRPRSIARDLGFDAISRNSLDAVCDRDSASIRCRRLADRWLHLSRSPRT